MERIARWIVAGFLCLVIVVATAPAFAASHSAAPKTTGSVDVNNATEAQLETLPGVGPATAQKIIGGRPYSSMEDLKAKTGMSDATVAKLNGHVTFGPAGAAPAATSSTQHGKGHSSGNGHSKGSESAGAPSSKPAHKTAPAAPVDINTATAAQLETLPGVGPSTANKIIGGRPYSSTADLAKLHLPKGTMDKIMPSVTASAVAGAPAAAAPANRTVPASAAPAAAPAPTSAHARTSSHAEHESGKPAAEAQVPPAKGMVWVNLDSKVYHYEGDQWYGRTKNGKFMSEQDAIAAGYRAAKKSGHHDDDKDEDKDADDKDR